MNLTPTRMLAILLTFAFFLGACRSEQTSPTPAPADTQTSQPATPDSDAIGTSVAQTVEAELTQAAQNNPTNTPAPTATLPSSPTPTVGTPEPTSTSVPTLAAGEGTLPNHARFLEDVTIPDGTILVAGQTFTKTWRVQNIGSETWTPEYSFVFINGDRMEGQALTLTQQTLPGGVLDISIPMVAPLQPGTYTGYWMLQAPDTEAGDDGPVFGIGANASQALFVQINVILPTATPSPTLTPTATPEGSTPVAATSTPAPTVLNVSLGVDNNAFFGTCPTTLNFNAVITLTGPLSFNYRVNGIPSQPNLTFPSLPADAVTTTQTGLHTVAIPFTLTASQSLSGQVIFEITAPTAQTSPPIAIAITCQ